MNKINKYETGIDGLYVLEPTVYGDERGYFFESYNEMDYNEIGITNRFVQDNQSKSTKGVLRGLHFQVNHPQAKLVRVLKGTVYDVAVDLRPESKTYAKWKGVVLSDDNKKQFMIPRGFAHGFIVLSDEAIFSYKCDEYYHPEDEGGIIWNDPELNIDWQYDGTPILSQKDKNHPKLSEAIR